MSHAFQVEVTPLEALSDERIALWRAMQASDPALASPYFRPEYAQVAVRASPRSAVAVFRQDGRDVGFFPFQRRGQAIQPIGAPMNDYHGVIAFPGQGPTLDQVARLLNPSRMNVGAWVGCEPIGEGRACLMSVMPEGGFDTWYDERRRTFGKYFKDKERARRSLEAEHGPIRSEWGLRDPDLLDRLIAMKRDQYRRTRRHDIFACGWTRDLLHALVASDGEDGFGCSMAAMWAGGRLMAIELSLHAGRHYHFWFPAYDPEVARCSPGILLSLDTMRLAGEAGYRVFDFGPAGEGYKKYFVTAEQPVREAVIVRPGLGASLGQAAVGLLDAGGAHRGERLRQSLRRRWAAIEACETNLFDRMRGAAQAAGAAARRLSDPSPLKAGA